MRTRFNSLGRVMVTLLSPVLLLGLIQLQSCKKDDTTDPGSGNNNSGQQPNPTPTVSCPTFTNLEVIYDGNTFSVTSALIDCESDGSRWIINHGSTSGTRVRVVFAAKPGSAKKYKVIDGSNGKKPGADECYIQVQKDASTIWNSKAGGEVLACTSDEDGTLITRAKWEELTIVKVSGGSAASSSGQTGCME